VVSCPNRTKRRYTCRWGYKA